MISCEEAAILCNKTQYEETTFVQKLKLRFHLFMCRACAGFTKKNTKLSLLCEKANLQVLSKHEKIKMKEQLQKKY